MGIEFNRGFFIFDKSWIQENQFMQSLSHAEYRIMVYLLSSALKISKRDARYKRGELIASLYQRNHILFANVSQSTIADRCGINRATAYKALKKFNDIGAVIKMSEGGKGESNDYFIIGFENHRQDKDGKQEYYLIDSIPIRNGRELPDHIKEFIRGHYKDDLFFMSDLIWEGLFGTGKGS
jgi:DNA-binding MarR family transcriptional regulator